MTMISSDRYSASESPARRETLPAVKCASWCVDGDGHTGAKSVEDQQCYSEVLSVPLTREPMVLLEGDEWALEYVQAYLERAEGSLHTVVHVGKGETPGFVMTLAEVEAFCESLVQLARLARIPTSSAVNGGEST